MGALTSLEELILSENDFSLGLPQVVTEMLSMEILILGNASSCESSGCRLRTLPEEFEKLKNLHHLDISYNKLTIFPSAIYRLSELRTLKLRGNRKVKRIEKNLKQLPNLQELDIRDCESLKYPPKAVCEQGLTAMKQYFKDLEKGKETKLSSVPVAVLGASLSGKTSLIRSLQAEERKLTFRDESSAKDDATKVFDVQALHFKEFSVKFIDYGGHDIYHVAYDVAKKDLCLPIVVVSMKQFADMCAERDSKEATRKLLFDWLSHLYVACPSLGPPILVLTYADKFSADSFLEHRAVLEDAAETIKSDILKEENQLSEMSPGVLRHIDHFRQTDQPFIHSDDIFVFSNDVNECENIQQLRHRILNRCREFSNVIPEQWNTIEQYIKSVDHFHVDLSAIKRQGFQVEDIIVVLRYLHNSGSILWFDMHHQLSDYVFYNIPAIVNMITTLFHHSADKEWEHRQKNFLAFFHEGVKIEIAKYRELIKEFTQNGLLAEALLVHLMDTNKFPVKIAICLLKAFCIVHGPLKDQLTSYYIVPYFAEEQMPDDWKTNGHLKLRMEMRFRGLAPPKYVFHQVTVTVLNCMASPLSVVDIYRQGATVRYRDNVMHLVHSFLNDMFTLQISTTSEELGDSWYQLLKTCCTVLQALKSAWPASRVEMLMYCAHCLAVNDKEPSHVADPDWLFSGGEVDFCNIRTFGGTDKVACKRCKGRDGKLVPKVPCPLVKPCYNLSEKDIEVVKRFLTDLKKPPACTVQQLTIQSNESDSELSDSLDYMDEDKKNLDIIRLPLKSTTRPDIINLFSSQSVYKMSSPVRGRCLIINNQHFEVPIAIDQTRLGSRPGSETDGENLQRVLTSLSFHCGEIKTDVPSQNMLEMIKEETKNPSHKNYGMFVLVIMSHGTETTIFGSDGRSVELSQIYDLMSPFKFKAMKDKPKWIILQACSGVRRDLMTDAVPLTSSSQATGSVPPQPAPRRVNAAYTSQASSRIPPIPAPRQHSAHPLPPHVEPPPPDNQSTDDLFIMRASFPSYVSIRHERNGSWFIRALVEALYKHACHRDLDTLFHQQVRKKVSRKSRAAYQQYKEIGGQQPLIITTPTKGRKLYLFPGYEPKSFGENPAT